MSITFLSIFRVVSVFRGQIGVQEESRHLFSQHVHTVHTIGKIHFKDTDYLFTRIMIF